MISTQVSDVNDSGVMPDNKRAPGDKVSVEYNLVFSS
jgi:hypothetical protein